MYEICIYNTKDKRSWIETFESFYLFRKRLIKLRYSNYLKVLAHSNLR